jgi:DNA-binding HxlR family transcriptional regulator
MVDYGQFCPVAKATELIGERWTILIIRELVLGTHRFNDFQRALSRISPALLTKRLKSLDKAGIIVKKKQQGRRGYQYFLTPAGRQLSPIIEHLATWGMRWARGQLTDGELDIEFLMWEIQRRLDTKALPDGETVLCFIFEELTQFKSWWIVINGDEVDLCTKNPGKDVDLYLSTTVRTMVEIWEGEIGLKTAQRKNLLKANGSQQLVKTLTNWFGICLYADVKRGDPALKRVASEDLFQVNKEL